MRSELSSLSHLKIGVLGSPSFSKWGFEERCLSINQCSYWLLGQDYTDGVGLFSIPTCLQVYTSSASTISLNKRAAVLKVRKHTEHSYLATCHKAGRTHSTLPLLLNFSSIDFIAHTL